MQKYIEYRVGVKQPVKANVIHKKAEIAVIRLLIYARKWRIMMRAKIPAL